MHELSFAESTLELTLRRAREAGAARVVALYLVVGEFTPLEPASLEFYWDQITKGTPADGSRVTVRRVPAQLTCTDCGADFDGRDETWVCRACGSSRLRMTRGDECYLEAIDVETPEHSSPGCPLQGAKRDEARSSPGCEARSSTGYPLRGARGDEA